MAWGQIAAYAGGEALDAATGGGKFLGIFGSEGNDAKTQRALSAGAAMPGPFNEVDLHAALQRATPGAVASLKRAVEDKQWLTPRLAGFQWDPGHQLLARASVFLAHGGKDGKFGSGETMVKREVQSIMDRYGGGGDWTGAGGSLPVAEPTGTEPAPWGGDIFAGQALGSEPRR